MNRLLFSDNLKWLRLVCHPEPVEGSLPNASVVELVEALKKILKTSQMMVHHNRFACGYAFAP